MIEQSKRKQNYYMRNKIIKEVGENASANDVLIHLLGDNDGCNSSDYVVHKYEYNQKRSIFNRVNYLWVYPLFILSIPFTWLFTGDFGIKRTSRIGAIVNWLVKFSN